MRKILLVLASLLCPLAHGTTIACITTPGTYDATLGASWVGGTAPNIAGGDSITCATSGVKEIFSTNYIIGNSPASGTKVINFTAGSTVGPGHNVTLTVKGDALASFVSEAAGSSILFDSTGAGSPTSTPYTLTANAFVQDASFPTSNTTGNIFTLTANLSGTNFRWVNSTAGSGITGFINYLVSNCGDSGGAAPCLSYTPGGSGILTLGATSHTALAITNCAVSGGVATLTAANNFVAGDTIELYALTGSCFGLMTGTTTPVLSAGLSSTQFEVSTTAATLSSTATTGSAFTFYPGTFDTTCGIKWNTGTTSNDGWLLDATFKNTYSTCPALSLAINNVQNSGVVRVMNNMVFDTQPTMEAPTSTINNSIFYLDFAEGVLPGVVGTINYSWIRIPKTHTGGVQTGEWNHTGTFIYSDPMTTYSAGTVQAPASSASGTTSASSSGSITDPSASFSSGNITNCVAITSGAAAGETREVVSATGATVLNVAPPFSPAPSGAVTYAVYTGQLNPHYTTITANQSVMTFAHVIGWLHGCDQSGDFWHGANSANTLYNFPYTTLLPNVAQGNTGTLATLGAATGIQYSLPHPTVFTGQQTLSLCEGCGSPGPDIAGKVVNLTSGIYWALPTVNYVSGGGNIGPYKADISQGTVPGNLADQVAHNCNFGSGPTESCANFNFGWGTVPNSASANGPGYCSTVVSGCNAGYNVNSTVIMGAHDVDNINPGFRNGFADPRSWGWSLGLTQSPDAFQNFAPVLNQMMSVNDPSGHNPAFNPIAFYNYIGVMLAPTNAAYHNTAADGTDVGAWDFLPPVVNPADINGSAILSGSGSVQ